MEALGIILVYTLLISGLNMIKGKSNSSYVVLFTLALVVNMSINKIVTNEIVSGAIFIILHQICLNVFERIKMVCF